MKQIAFSIFIATILFSTACLLQKNSNVIYSRRVHQKILLGKVTRNDLQKAPFKEWFDKEYNSYNPDEETIKKLKQFIPQNAKITIVFGTWCPDSRREVPRFLKILDSINFNTDSLVMYAVDRDFTAGKEDISKFQIKRIPTIIYEHYGYTAGRIVEKPKISLEQDLLRFTQIK